jgi:hypothetical protein
LVLANLQYTFTVTCVWVPNDHVSSLGCQSRLDLLLKTFLDFFSPPVFFVTEIFHLCCYLGFYKVLAVLFMWSVH